MKNTLIFSVIGLTLILLTSCKDKIDLIGAGQESAVVIGILDQSESTHYVKITRTFIGDGVTNSLDIATIPDSSYFNQVDITIQEILANGSQGRSFTLHDTIIQNKDENGVFYAPQQKVYVFYTTPAAPLLADATYKMTAKIDNGRIIVTGQTQLVSGISAGTWANGNASMKLTANGNALGEYATQSLNLPNVGNSYKMNGKVRFDYREYAIGMTDSTDHAIWFNLGEYDIIPGANTSQTFTFSGETFYRTVKDKVPVSSSIEKRIYLGFDVQITGASRELANYIEVSKPSSSLAQNKPKYTNLTITEGHTVLGIFGARYTFSVYKPAVSVSSITQGMDKKSRRELCAGPVTGTLSFCSQHALDNPESWSCN